MTFMQKDRGIAGFTEQLVENDVLHAKVFCIEGILFDQTIFLGDGNLWSSDSIS